MYIEVNGINMYYEELGSGKPIILIHGNCDGASYMKFIGRKLSKEYKVYLIDRRGCGKSERNCNISYEETAEDVFQFITKKNIEKPVIIGSSGGGSVAIYLAMKYSDKLSKVVLCSAVARKDSVKMPGYVKILSKLKWYPNKKQNDRFFKLVAEQKDISQESLKKISVKTLVVNGEKDIVSVDEAKYLASSIPNSELLILKGETHTSYLVRIKWYEKLKKFIEE